MLGSGSPGQWSCGTKSTSLGKMKVNIPLEAWSAICSRLKSKGSLPKNNVKKCKLSQPTRGS